MPGENENKNPVDQTTQNNNSGNNENVDQTASNNNSGDNEKKFTQTEVNAMMAKEKREGKQSILKQLGFGNEEEAKNAFSLLKALTDSQKSDEQKANEKKDNAINEKNEAEKRAIEAESKLSCFTHGVNKDSIDDVLAIANSKVTEDKNLDKVLDEMKKDKRYSLFFEGSNNQGNSGTGHTPGHSSNKDNDKGGYGKSLASNNSSSKKERKSYFN